MRGEEVAPFFILGHKGEKKSMISRFSCVLFFLCQPRGCWHVTGHFVKKELVASFTEASMYVHMYICQGLLLVL